MRARCKHIHTHAHAQKLLPRLVQVATHRDAFNCAAPIAVPAITSWHHLHKIDHCCAIPAPCLPGMRVYVYIGTALFIADIFEVLFVQQWHERHGHSVLIVICARNAAMGEMPNGACAMARHFAAKHLQNHKAFEGCTSSDTQTIHCQQHLTNTECPPCAHSAIVTHAHASMESAHR